MTEQQDIDGQLDDDGKRWGMGKLFVIVMLVYAALFGGWKLAHAQTQPWDTNITTWSWDGICGSVGCEGFELQHATSPTATTWTPIASLAPTARSYTANGVSEGLHCYRLITLAKVDDLDSAPSNVSCKTNVRPSPPVIVNQFLLTTGGPVYIASPNYTTFSWKLGAIAGTIPAKMKCDPTRKIGTDYYRVTSPITWAAGQKSYVVARCQLQ